MITKVMKKGRVLRPFFYEKKNIFLNKAFIAVYIKLYYL